jgi:hypothetical protein
MTLSEARAGESGEYEFALEGDFGLLLRVIMGSDVAIKAESMFAFLPVERIVWIHSN